jgi:hypothetical protein
VRETVVLMSYLTNGRLKPDRSPRCGHLVRC